jgi:HD-like signal output (HDOD) protein
MKPRSALTGTEIAELHDFLDRKLERIGVPSRPEVALRLLELSNDPRSEMKDYANVIRTDQAMSGRVLRLANSALFVQRTPVSSLDRACLVLGLERIKAVCLGLQLSHAAACASRRDISREVWGQSVFRACFAAEAARIIAPTFVPEAFVIGLMLDAGVPLMTRLVGEGYPTLYAESRSPGALFRRENETLGFTHVDVVTVMARRWRFPDLLAGPLTWHHTRPADLRRAEPVHRLHRIAYAVGMLTLEHDTVRENEELKVKSADGVVSTQRLLGVTHAEAAQIFPRTIAEYTATVELFSDVAASIADVDSLFERVSAALVRSVDDAVERSLAREEAAGPVRFLIGGRSIELRRQDDGTFIAYLYDSLGQRLLAHRFSSDPEAPRALAEAFDLDISDPQERQRLSEFVMQQAA